MTPAEEMQALQIQYTPEEQRASLLINAWTAAHGGKQCPWKIAVEITAICTHMSIDEMQRLQNLENEE